MSSRRPSRVGYLACLVLAWLGSCSLVFEEGEPVTQGPCQDVIALSSDGDDGEIGTIGGTLQLMPNGELGPGLNAIYLGFWDGTKTAGYYRFALPNGLNAGEPLEDVRLRLWGKGNDNWDTDSDQLLVQLENVPDATRVASVERAPFESDANPLVSRDIVWPATGGLVWFEGGFNESPNLAPMFEALADAQDGIEPGAHVMLWVSGNFEDGNREVASEDFFIAKPLGHEAQLVVSRCAP